MLVHLFTFRVVAAAAGIRIFQWLAALAAQVAAAQEVAVLVRRGHLEPQTRAVAAAVVAAGLRPLHFPAVALVA